MAAPKCRIDVWQPTILNVTTTGATTTAQRPAVWVKCDTVTDVTTENPPGPNLNLRRANACTAVEIKDEMFSPRIAYISIANRPQDFRAFDDETMETQHQDSDGDEIQINGSDAKTRIRRNWGPFSFFFKEFQLIRIVDLETHLVLFTGRVYKVSKKHDGQRGATVELVCKDALEELKNISMSTMPKELHFPAYTYRSTIIQSLLNLGFNYKNSLGAGGHNRNNTSPTTTPLSALPVASNDANTSTVSGSSGDPANSYSRFERSMTSASPITKLRPRKSGSKNLLSELTRWAILEPHENETAENQFGYDFFLDSNIGSDNLLATTAPPPYMFNYFKRGNRLSAYNSAGQDANTYGLTCILPTVARATHTGLRQRNVGTTAGTGTSSQTTFLIETDHSLYPGQVIIIGSEQMYVQFTSTDENLSYDNLTVIRGWSGSTAASFVADVVIKENRPATAIMQKDSSSFDDVKDELFTDCDLTYDTSYFIGTYKFGTREKTKKFEIMFASEISYGDTPNSTSTFAWSGKDFDDDSAPIDADEPGTDSAEYVSAYREDGTTALALTVARIQYQSTRTISGATNFGYIMLSDIATNFPTANYSGENYIVLKGLTSNATCRVNLDATEVQEGRPSTAFAAGSGDFRRVFTMTKETHENVDDIRHEVAARLGQSTIAMKRGNFTTSKAPYYWADFKVRSVSADGSTGQNVTVKSDNGTNAVAITNYGFREGMLVHKRTSDGTDDWGKIATVEVSGVDKDVYGYCYDMASDTAFKVNLTESQSFAVDDEIRLYIPIRAGDAMFVDHILANVYGEHLVTAVNFNEMPIPTTSYSTLGENEPRMRMRVGSVHKQSIWNTIAVETLEARERENPNLPKGIQTFSFSGTWSYPASNRVAWTAGNLRVSDGAVYQIVASNTNGGTGTGGNDTTYGLGSSGMTSNNKYVVYLDPEEENSSGNTYHLYTIISTSYVEDGDKIVVLKGSVGDALANAFPGPNLDLALTDGPSHDAPESIHDNSATSALLKKGAQHWSTNVKFEGTDYNIARWGLSTSIGSNGSISFGDDDTEVVTAHAGHTFSAGTSWVYKTVGSSAVALPVVTQTYSDVTRADSDRILMATVVVDSDVGQGSPTIFPVNGNTPTISVGALAARSILATNIKAGSITASEIETGSITTGQLNFTYASEINGNSGLNSDSTASIRLVANAESGTVGGLSVSASTFFIGTGTGTFGNANTPFFVRGVNGSGGTRGDFSLGDKFIWDESASALTIKGTISASTFLTNPASVRSGNTLSAGNGILIDSTGIIAASGIGSGNVEFELRAGTDGKAYFGAGACTIGKGGIHFPVGGAGAPGISWEYNSLSTWLYREASGNKIILAHTSSGTPAGGAFWLLNMDVHAVDGDFFHATTSLAPLYGGEDSDADSLHTHDSLGGGGGASLSGTNTWTAVNTFADSVIATKSSTTTSSFWSQSAPGQFDLGMWVKDEASAPSSPTSSFIRIYSDGNVLKYKKSNGTIITLDGSGSGGGTIQTGEAQFLAIYEGGSSGDSTTIGDLKSASGSTVLGWKTLGAGTLAPVSHAINGIGLLYQNTSDIGLKFVSASHNSGLGDPPYTFSQYPTTGISFALTQHISSTWRPTIVFETNSEHVLHIDIRGMKVLANRSILPEGNNGSYIGGSTTNAYTASFSGDKRFKEGNFYDFSTSRKAHFHYALGSSQAGGEGTEPQGGHGVGDDASRVHITCPLYYDNVHVPLSGGGETTVDMEIITYANNNQHKMVRATSTERAKNNIRDLEIDTSKVWDLKPRSFEWKGDGTTAFGLIAEEVDDIIPGLVAKYAHGSDEVRPQSVHYKYLGVLMLEEMRKLKARIEELEKEKDND